MTSWQGTVRYVGKLVTSWKGAGRLVTSWQGTGRYAGKLVTSWEGGRLEGASGELVVLGGRETGNWVEEDPSIQALVDKYLPPVRAYQHQVVGAPRNFLFVKIPIIRKELSLSCRWVP